MRKGRSADNHVLYRKPAGWWAAPAGLIALLSNALQILLTPPQLAQPHQAPGVATTGVRSGLAALFTHTKNVADANEFPVHEVATLGFEVPFLRLGELALSFIEEIAVIARDRRRRG
jgi:hypothetical protein